MRKLVVGILAIFSIIAFLGWSVVRIIDAYAFETNCSQYIKRAADASSVEVAKRELGKAIEYCEANGLTEGVVSIFLKQPKNDIGFWYENLTIAYAELDSLPEDSTPLEKTNMLMKIRESLTDADGDGGITVTHPEGISIYPNNVMYFWWGTLSGIASLVFAIWWFFEHLYDYY